MDELSRALDEIAAIRGQMARVAEFRGYGPAALMATAGFALLAGFAQAVWVPQPLSTPGSYAYLWSVAAAAAAAMIAIEAVARTRRLHRGLADVMIRAALEQFLPAAVAGLLLTLVLLRAAPSSAGLLPGLWQVIFALGVFATSRFLPRAIMAVGGWYLATGLACIAASGDAQALAPWRMAAPFAVGQAMAAFILWRASRVLPEVENGG
ncbi:MAG TPA: hypothetical protein VIC32_02695 [Terriglobales bacterium]|jgi:hypothetical protein